MIDNEGPLLHTNRNKNFQLSSWNIFLLTCSRYETKYSPVQAASRRDVLNKQFVLATTSTFHKRRCLLFTI